MSINGIAGELRFDGRVALVTGAGRGLGREHALLLARRGAKVVVNNRSSEPAEAVVEEIRAAGGEALAYVGDVLDPAQAAGAVEAALDRFGRIDIVVNNAGGTSFLPFEQIDAETRDDVVLPHYRGAWDVTRAAWPHMIDQRYGRVVMIVSSSALYGIPNNAPYGAAKGAMIGLALFLAQEGLPHGIQVNALATAGFTRMAETHIADVRLREWMRQHLNASHAAQPLAWLVHEDCKLNGGIYSVGGPRLTQMIVGETGGFYAPAEGAFTPESIRDSFDKVSSLDGFQRFASMGDSMRHRSRVMGDGDSLDDGDASQFGSGRGAGED